MLGFSLSTPQNLIAQEIQYKNGKVWIDLKYIKVANEIFVEHEHQKLYIEQQKREIISLEKQNSLLVDKNSLLVDKNNLLMDKYNHQYKLTKEEKNKNKKNKIIIGALIVVSTSILILK